VDQIGSHCIGLDRIGSHRIRCILFIPKREIKSY